MDKKQVRKIAEAVAIEVVERKRRDILNDIGGVVLEGQVAFSHGQGHVDVRIGYTDLARMLEEYFEPGTRVKLFVVPDVGGNRSTRPDALTDSRKPNLTGNPSYEKT